MRCISANFPSNVTYTFELIGETFMLACVRSSCDDDDVLRLCHGVPRRSPHELQILALRTAHTFIDRYTGPTLGGPTPLATPIYPPTAHGQDLPRTSKAMWLTRSY